MDPTETQADKTNDSHSLESNGGADADAAAAADQSAGNATDAPKTKDGVVDATGGSAGAPAPQKAKKESGIKKLWHKFNIYLLLFILVIVVAVGILVFLTIKGKQTAKTNLKSAGLSQSVLQQLASTDVTVGDSKQILTVQSNAIFAGAVLVRSALEVAGSLQVGGTLIISDLTVSGATQLGDTQTKNLTVAGALNIQGALSLKSGINVTGDSTFTGTVTVSKINAGALQLTGDLNLTHHLTAGGTIPNITRGSATGGGGTVSLSGSDTAGSITVNTGSAPPAGCFATVTFSTPFNTTPHIVVTPVGAPAAGLDIYITRTTTQLVICSNNAAVTGQSFGFDYVALD